MLCRTQNKQATQTAPLRIPVPPGTVVRRKRGAVLLADLTHPGVLLTSGMEAVHITSCHTHQFVLPTASCAE